MSVLVPSLRVPRWAASPCLLAVRALSLVACLSPDGLVLRGTLWLRSLLVWRWASGASVMATMSLWFSALKEDPVRADGLLDGRPVRTPSVHPGSVGLGVGRAYLSRSAYVCPMQSFPTLQAEVTLVEGELDRSCQPGQLLPGDALRLGAGLPLPSSAAVVACTQQWGPRDPGGVHVISGICHLP